MSTEPVSITQKAVGALKWTALIEIVSRTASPIVFVILARLLSPVDFGIVATAMITISFSQMFWDAGLSKALIQTDEIPEQAAHVVFWSNVVLSLIIYTLIFLFAPMIAMFFDSPASELVLRILGLQIVIASLSSVQQALFARDMNFKRLFWIKLLTAFIPGMFSIPLAFLGFGVWALVIGTLTGQLLNLLLLWHFSTWRPKMEWNKQIFKKMSSFGSWVVAESFGGWLIMWGDSLIVGKYLGTHDLGMYRTGVMLISIIYGLVLNPFLPVLYPTFSRLQLNRIALKESFHNANRVVTALALPMGVGLLLISPQLATIFFGNKWEGLGFVMAILGIKEAIAWLVGINAETYRAMGKPDVNTKLMYFQILYFIPGYLIAVQFGIETFLYVRLALCILSTPLHVYLCNRMLGVSPFYIWNDGKYFILSAIFMGLIVESTNKGVQFMAPDLPQVVTLIFLIVSGAISYTLALWTLDRTFVEQTIQRVRKVVK